jgi:hypothetical protein
MARKRYVRALSGSLSPTRFMPTDRTVVRFGDVVELGAQRSKIEANVADRWMRRAHTVHETLTGGESP